MRTTWRHVTAPAQDSQAAGRSLEPVASFWGADDGNISGASRFRAFVGVVMVVHAGFATLLAKAPRKGTLGKMHLGPVQKALAEAEAAAKQAGKPAPARSGA